MVERPLLSHHLKLRMQREEELKKKKSGLFCLFVCFHNSILPKLCQTLASIINLHVRTEEYIKITEISPMPDKKDIFKGKSSAAKEGDTI